MRQPYHDVFAASLQILNIPECEGLRMCVGFGIPLSLMTIRHGYYRRRATIYSMRHAVVAGAPQISISLAMKGILGIIVCVTNCPFFVVRHWQA
ncbi:MAG: hypothetical protein K9K79_06580 [Desulfohalobiaceae bacterium]|nr:hypothetical protein [Desulfohalobiaceae bacterium]